MTGLEPLIAAAASSVVKVATETFMEKSGWLARTLGTGVNERIKSLISAASEKYAVNYIQRHGILKVLGMKEPVSLESVYLID